MVFMNRMFRLKYVIRSLESCRDSELKSIAENPENYIDKFKEIAERYLAYRKEDRENPDVLLDVGE